MSILTNNPGYISAAAYAADPASVETPNPFHNESDQGSRSYVLERVGVANAADIYLARVMYLFHNTAGTGSPVALTPTVVQTTPANDSLGIISYVSGPNVNVSLPPGKELKIEATVALSFSVVGGADFLTIEVEGNAPGALIVIDYAETGRNYSGANVNVQDPSATFGCNLDLPSGTTTSVSFLSCVLYANLTLVESPS
jgi:hypothetical protein